MRTITLEEHFVTRDFLHATGAEDGHTPDFMRALRARLLDLGEGRIAAMDEGGVDLQVLSLASMGIDKLSPADESTVLHDAHDEVAAAVAANPTRLAAFATPGLRDPAGAVKELQRCITQLHFKGLMVDGTTEGKFLDAPDFFPLLEACVALDVPLYIHPAPPPQPVFDAYYANLPGESGHMLSIAGWGWHSETAIHILRMILAGVFERLPKLRVIIGHMGEGLPYALARTNGVLSQATKTHSRNVFETITSQVWITTSGYFTRPPFDCCRAVIGLDRMLYSIDYPFSYPFSPTTKGRDYLSTLDLTEAEQNHFTHGLAETLLNF
jgi:predicted TIM-barrel fold metal-dependent hydrolase